MHIEVTDNNFKTLLFSGKPLVIDFWAPWCGPCRMMSPVIDGLADENPLTCEDYGIMSIPTILFFRNGELVNRHVGACPKSELKQIIDNLL